MIVALGSSSVSARSALPGALTRRLGEPVDARGIVGSRVAQWAELAPNLDAIEGHGVIVLLGGNDGAPRASDVLSIHRALVRQGARAVAWLPPPVYLAGSVAHGRDRRMRAALDAARVPYARREVRLTRAQFAPDLVHPTRAGYERWAMIVAPELRTLLTPAAPAGASLLPFGLLALGALAVLVW